MVYSSCLLRATRGLPHRYLQDLVRLAKVTIGKSEVTIREEKISLCTREMIRSTRIEDPWTKGGRECEIGRCITSLDNRSNGGRFGCLSVTKILIFSRRNNDSLRRRCGGVP